VTTGEGRAELLDGLISVGDAVALVRLCRSSNSRKQSLTHVLQVGGFDRPVVVWDEAAGMSGDLPVRVVGPHPSVAMADGWLQTTVTVGTAWTGLAVVVGDPGSEVSPSGLFADVLALEVSSPSLSGRMRLPRRHPERASDALGVLRACTNPSTGAVIASPTTSLPEAVGGDRQFDYRYCWLRDAALAVSVASLLGDGDAARRCLAFLGQHLAQDADAPPVATVTGDAVPDERSIPGIEGWGGSRPVRVGNAAADQIQYDALGMVLEAVSVHLQTGGRLDAATWRTVRAAADKVAAAPLARSNGIWELRDEHWLTSADLGRWLVLDRAIWITRGWRPLRSRRRWKQARAEARGRVLRALDADGRLPQTYDEPPRADAAALLVVMFGLLKRKDPRAHKLVDTVLEDLSCGPYLYRYRPDPNDGFTGIEGVFLPASFWAVSALAALGRVDEAVSRMDALCAVLPRLLAEEVDPTTGDSLGNVPLVWSHAEAARALYILDAATLRRRFGPVGLWAWRLTRFARLRAGRRG